MTKRYAVLIAIALLVGIAVGQAGRRFELQADENFDLGINGEIEVFAVHDNGSGMELLCVRKRMFEGLSCTPTGRNWK